MLCLIARDKKRFAGVMDAISKRVLDGRSCQGGLGNGFGAQKKGNLGKWQERTGVGFTVSG